MRVALVHDSMTEYGGAEKVLEEIHLLFPDAPVYTSIFTPEAFPEPIRAWDVRTSWMDRLPLAHRAHRALFMLYPMAMNAFDMEEYDLVISSSFNFAHHIVAGPRTQHLCYCHSPARFLWDAHNYARRERLAGLPGLVHKLSLSRLRALDRSAVQNVDAFVATSRLVQGRIDRFYRRPSEIVPPPIDIDAFAIADAPPDEPYFLVLARLVGWKRVDIAVDACTEAGLPLIVAGFGREQEALMRRAGPSVHFVGQVGGARKAQLLSHCTALILPSNEDFGITPLEAMASGRPVVALREGGALDTVIEGRTGLFFDAQTPESLGAALRRFDARTFDPKALRAHARCFDRSQFQSRMREIIYEMTSDAAAVAIEARVPMPPVPTRREKVGSA